MKLQNHKRTEWNPADLPLTDLLRKIDQVYADPELTAQRFFDAGALRRIHISKRADLLVTEAGGRPVCVKYFHDSRWRVKLRTFFGGSKGRRGYRNGLKLAKAGVRVPEQLACVELRPFGPTLVMMELLENICTAARFLMEQQKSGGVPRAVLQQFAAWVAGMHRHGVYHCDFSPRNVIVQQTEHGIEFVLIDLEDVRFGRPLDRRRSVQNLARFAREALPHLSAYKVMRFLHFYLQETGQGGSVAALARALIRARSRKS
jgi:tRNA A-37 threonylcarbamoyl transferase component Bud32